MVRVKRGGDNMEFWDAYTRDEKLTDKVLVRGTPIPEGLYHLT